MNLRLIFRGYLHWLVGAHLLLATLPLVAMPQASQVDVDTLMRVGGISQDIQELSRQLIGEIESELVALSPDDALAPAEIEATLRAARAAFDAERFDRVVHDVLSRQLDEKAIASRIEDYSSDFGQRLVALEGQEKQRASGPEFQAFIASFGEDDVHAWRRAEVAAMYERHDIAADQVTLFVEVQIAVLIGIARVTPELDPATVSTLVASLRERELTLADAFASSGIDFTGWLYRNLDDAEFALAMDFYRSETAHRIHDALMSAYREAIVSGGLLYGQEVMREQRMAESRVEI